jgi:hypothetical protein
MSLQAVVANPFMLLVNPEVVLAAVEKSERLNGLNRHLCRPLDKVMPSPVAAADAAVDAEGEVESDNDSDNDVDANLEADAAV